MEDFKQQLRELVIYTMCPQDREDEDIVESYFQSFLFACETYKNLNK